MTRQGFIVFTRRAGGVLEAWWGTRDQYDDAVLKGHLTQTDWSLDDAPTTEIQFESIMWAPPVEVMRPVGPEGQLQRTSG